MRMSRMRGWYQVDWRGEQQQRDYNDHHDDHKAPGAFHTVLLRRSVRRLNMCSPFFEPIISGKVGRKASNADGHGRGTIPPAAVHSWRMKNMFGPCVLGKRIWQIGRAHV